MRSLPVLAGLALAAFALRAAAPGNTAQTLPVTPTVPSPYYPAPSQPPSQNLAPLPPKELPDDATLNNTMLNDGERVEAEEKNAVPEGAVSNPPSSWQARLEAQQQAAARQTQEHQTQVQQHLESMDQSLESIDQQSAESAAIQQQQVAIAEQNVAIREAGQERAQTYGNTLRELISLGNALSNTGSLSMEDSLAQVSQNLEAMRENAAQFAGQQENVWLTQAIQNLSEASYAIDASNYVYVQYALDRAQVNLRRALNAAGGATSP